MHSVVVGGSVGGSVGVGGVGVGVIIIGRRGSIGSIGSIGAIGNTGAIGSTPEPTGGSGFTPDITWFPTPRTPGFPSVVLMVGRDFLV